MTRLPPPDPRPGRPELRDPQWTLRDLIEAVCTGFVPTQGLEMMLDRIEGTK